MLAIGTFEFGSAFGDRTAMANSVREGARVGSAAGPNVDADCRIIEASAGALAGIAGNNVEWLWIYKSDTSGSFPVNERQAYRPTQTAADVDLTCAGGDWNLFQPGWPATGRQNGGANRDWLGVRIEVEHDWKTGFLWWNGSTRWQESAIMRLEPATS
jgi:hypothetical protein